MSLSSRSLRRSVFSLLCVLPGVCAAQNQQFANQPLVELTGGGRVTSFVTGTLQEPAFVNGGDILYVNAPAGSGATQSVTVGELLGAAGGYANLGEDQIAFPGVTNVVAAVGDFNGDGVLDYAFALTTTAANVPNLCIYFGTGAQPPSIGHAGGGTSFSGGNVYPAVGPSFCTRVPTLGTQPPVFNSIAYFPFKTNSSAGGVILEDSENNYFYILSITGTGVTTTTTSPLPTGLGSGPIYVGDLNGDGNNDFVINGQTGYEAWVWLCDGAGHLHGLTESNAFDDGVHSMLLHDMDGDGVLDMVVEDAQGAIEIFHGNGDGTFAAASEGGTPVGGNGMTAGGGGHLAAIDPNNLDILTTTPIGLSVLTDQISGNLLYNEIWGPYNIGPGRSSFALADLFGTNTLDFAVDSPQGVAIVQPDSNGDRGFKTSYGFPALAPALDATVGKFRSVANNPNGYPDVVVSTGATQAKWLENIGNGLFVFTASPTNTSGGPGNVPANLWSNIVSGDFNGDGNLDIAYSLTGLPLPAPGAGAGPGVYVQYGNGDGTFQAPVAVTGIAGADPLYGESAVGYFNGDNIADIANIGGSYDTTLLGQSGGDFNVGLNLAESNPSFNQVAAGFFKENRTSQQDLIFQQGSSFIPYKNAQDGTGKNFTAMPALTGAAPPLYPATVLLTDVDGDGNGDLVVVYYNADYNPVGAGPVAPNDLYIWYGNGDGTFSATPQVMTLSRNYYLAAVGDINGDGLPDLVLSDGSLVGVLYNQGAAGTPANRTFGAEQDFLAGQGINSISLADLTGNGELDLIAANGGVTISNAIALGGATASSLSLTPNPDVNTGGITVLMNNVTTLPVNGNVVAVPEPSAYGATFTLTATVTPVSGTTVPQGVVTFSIDGNLASCSPDSLTPVGGTSLSATATCVIPAGNTYAGGTHALTAYYGGNSVYTPATLVGTHAISGGTTTTTLYLCGGPTAACPLNGYVMPPYSSGFSIYYGQGWNGTVVVSASDNGAVPGNVSIYDAYTGAAAPPPSPLCVLPGSGGSCPAAVGTTLGTSVGTNVITAVYAGDTTHTGSTSLPVTITVLQDTTSGMTLAGSPNPSPLGQPVTFTATLSGNYAAPTGPVQFVETFPPTALVVVLGTANLVPGSGLSSTATFTTSTLPLGTDSIQAVYNATTDFAAASSPVITETITPSLAGSFTMTVTPNPVTVGVGYGALLTVTVTPQDGFSQGVNLSCSNLPSEASCIVNSAIPAGGGSATVIVQTTAPHSCGSNQPYFYGGAGKGPLAAPFALPALAGLLLLFVPGRRRWLRALVAVVAVATVMQISGCGNCTDLGTRPATYSFQITGTAADSSTSQSQAVTMTVTI